MSRPPRLAALRFVGANPSSHLLIKVDRIIDGRLQRMLNDTVVAFCIAVKMGAFCFLAGSTEVCSEIKSVQWNNYDADFEVNFGTVDHRSFQVLRQMLGGLQVEGVGVVEITVVGPNMELLNAKSPTVAQFETSEEAVYPLLATGVPLVGATSEETFSIGSRLRRCEITIDERVTTDHVDALREIAWPWFTILECGGFALPVEMPWVVNNVGGSVNPFDVCSLELTVLKFDSSEQAWLSLANMIHVAGPALGLRVVEIRVDD